MSTLPQTTMPDNAPRDFARELWSLGCAINRAMAASLRAYPQTPESVRTAYEHNCAERARLRALGFDCPDLPAPKEAL